MSDPFRDRLRKPPHPQFREQQSALIGALVRLNFAHRHMRWDARAFWTHLVLLALCTFALYLPWGTIWPVALGVLWFYLPFHAIWYEVGRRNLIYAMNVVYPALTQAQAFAEELQCDTERTSFDGLIDEFRSAYDEAYEWAKPWWGPRGADA